MIHSMRLDLFLWKLLLFDFLDYSSLFHPNMIILKIGCYHTRLLTVDVDAMFSLSGVPSKPQAKW